MPHWASEMHNLYGQPQYAKVQKKMHERLRKLQQHYDDPIEQEIGAAQ